MNTDKASWQVDDERWEVKWVVIEEDQDGDPVKTLQGLGMLDVSV